MTDEIAGAIAEIRRLFAEKGDSAYGGEAVSQREHALQAAHFAPERRHHRARHSRAPA